jgi:hypothetical protein
VRRRPWPRVAKTADVRQGGRQGDPQFPARQKAVDNGGPCLILCHTPSITTTSGCVSDRRTALSGFRNGRALNEDQDCGIAAMHWKGGPKLGAHALPAASIAVEK